MVTCLGHVRFFFGSFGTSPGVPLDVGINEAKISLRLIKRGCYDFPNESRAFASTDKLSPTVRAPFTVAIFLTPLKASKSGIDDFSKKNVAATNETSFAEPKRSCVSFLFFD